MLLLSTMVLKEGMKRTESKDAIKADLDGNLEGSEGGDGDGASIHNRPRGKVLGPGSKNNVKADLGDDIHGSEEVLDKDDGEVVTSHTHRVSNQARAMESETRAQFS